MSGLLAHLAPEAAGAARRAGGHDTKTGNDFTYNNPDGTGVTAIQSLDALPCP
jgi:hypothetical protein